MIMGILMNINDYKKALLQYIEQYNAVTFEDAKLKLIKQMYNSNIEQQSVNNAAKVAQETSKLQ